MKYDINLINRIIKDYKKGISSPKIAIKYNLTKRIVLNILKKNRINIINVNYKNLNEEYVIKLYKDGLSSLKISKLLKVSKYTILRILNKNKIVLIDKRKRYVNEKVFDKIDEISAYWIGVLITDGNVYVSEKRNPRITLVLQKRDLNHIIKFKEFLNTDANIFYKKSKFCKIDGKIYKSKEQCGISISSKYMAETLFKHGVIPRKSYYCKASDELKNNIHFWRGCIDGDGNISIKYKYITLYGCETLLLQYKDYLYKYFNIKAEMKKIKNIYSVKIGNKKDSHIVLNLMYSKQYVSLQRKLDIVHNVGR